MAAGALVVVVCPQVDRSLMAAISENAEVDRVMGRRPDGVAIDMPSELGYWCPICRVPPAAGELDERLHWSEYNGFLWCEVCNVDLPSALCVPLDAAPDPERPWVHAGPAAAVRVFLNSVTDVFTSPFVSDA